MRGVSNSYISHHSQYIRGGKMENPNRIQIQKIDISQLTREIGNKIGFAVGTYDILKFYIDKICPKVVIEINELGYYVLVGAERGDIISEFEKFYPYTRLEWTAEIVAEKFNVGKVLIIYGEWDTLVVFY
jgi:hypothetical protein